MAANAAYKDRQFLAVIGDEVSLRNHEKVETKLLTLRPGLRHWPLACGHWGMSIIRGRIGANEY